MNFSELSIEEIIEFVSHRSVPIKLKAIKILDEKIRSNLENEVEKARSLLKVREYGLRPLLDCLYIPNMEIVYYSLSLIITVCDDETISQIRRVGGIPIIINSLANSTYEKISTLLSILLYRLSFEDENKEVYSRANSLPLLLTYMENGNKDIQNYIFRTLFNISSNEKVQNDLVDNGACQKVYTKIKEFIDRADPNNMKNIAIGIYSNLALCSKAKDRFTREIFLYFLGFIEASRLLNDSEAEGDFQIVILKFLTNSSIESERNQMILGQLGLIPKLFDYFKINSQGNFTWILEHVLKCVANLAKLERNAVIIYDLNGDKDLSQVIKNFGDFSESCVISSATIYTDLASYDSVNDENTFKQSIQQLLGVSEIYPGNELVHCLLTETFISVHDDLRRKLLIEEGVIELLIQYLRESSVLEVICNSLKALQNIITIAESNETIIRTDLIPILQMNMLSLGVETVTLEVVKILDIVSEREEIIVVLSNQITLMKLVNILNTTNLTDTKSYITSTISNILNYEKDNTLKEVMLDLDGYYPIIDILKSENDELSQLKSLNMLSNMMAFENVRKEIQKPLLDAIAVLNRSGKTKSTKLLQTLNMLNLSLKERKNRNKTAIVAAKKEEELTAKCIYDYNVKFIKLTKGIELVYLKELIRDIFLLDTVGPLSFFDGRDYIYLEEEQELKYLIMNLEKGNSWEIFVESENYDIASPSMLKAFFSPFN
eukprot:TRINITY_DN3752_c0_g1_i1.p1 TRINITY_DN3752_c0_g1~~TRINITY_DN3752_c0_g1_i1.p1  ORF type:complete len:784 (+),score=145.61 TRINITY_DN3752_c0_g1_i1:198-2354(+)